METLVEVSHWIFIYRNPIRTAYVYDKRRLTLFLRTVLLATPKKCSRRSECFLSSVRQLPFALSLFFLASNHKRSYPLHYRTITTTTTMPGQSQFPSQLFCPFNANGDESRTTRNIRGDPQLFRSSCPNGLFPRNQSKSQSEILGDALSILRRQGSNNQLLPHGQSSPRPGSQSPWKMKTSS